MRSRVERKKGGQEARKRDTETENPQVCMCGVCGVVFGVWGHVCSVMCVGVVCGMVSVCMHGVCRGKTLERSPLKCNQRKKANSLQTRICL